MQQVLKQQAATGKRQITAVETEGGYRAPRYRVTLICEEKRGEDSTVAIQDSAAATSVLRPYFAGLDREHFMVLGLDAKHRIIGINLVSIGSLSLAIVHPREVFKPLILMNAAAWLCAHNHPSGDVTPSSEDRVLTKRLREA
jgi:DNA repair protein RadC